MLKATDLRGVIGIVPTPAKAGAEAWDAVDTVDLDETARLVEQLLQDGVKGIVALGTMGECATLTQKEYEEFVDCVLSTVRRRVPALIGTTAMGLHEVVSRLRFIRERGADGTLLGLPMWQPCTMDMAVEYYATLSKSFPDLAIMVYANPRAFRFDFPVSFWKRVVEDAPTIMAAKFSSLATFAEVFAVTRGTVNFIPPFGRAPVFAKAAPDALTACWVPAVGPQPAVALMDAILSKNWERMEEIEHDLEWAEQPTRPYVTNAEIFASFNIQIEKLQMNASGYAKAGPIRPPYHVVPRNIKEASEEVGRRLGELHTKYSKVYAHAAQ
jgi:dihydrodipicolinate synthase/N-acetylneuraminate lyase